jgi:beta-galactosidase
MRKQILAAVLVLLACVAHAQRDARSMDFDWRFHLGELAGAERVGLDDHAWRVLDVPHDWSIEGQYDEHNPGWGSTGYLPTGIAWYRKSFNVSAEDLKRTSVIVFDGVFMDSTVWVNGAKLGTEHYGYTSFAYDMTKHLHVGRNVIAVHVDNALQPAARWYTGSGIYGHVHWMLLPRTHVGLWRTFVRTPVVNAGSADVAVSTTVEGGVATALRFTVLDEAGKTVATTEAAKAEDAQPVVLHVMKPMLWSVDAPYLYTLRAEVLNGVRVVDREDTTFGIRTVRFDADKGFFLNGQPLKLKGVSDHWFAGVVGVGIPDSILERQLQMLKDMGVNAVRTAHNPVPPKFYELCDRMGLLVMDEIFDGWHQKVPNEFAARYFTPEEWHHDVNTWVRRDRNHPSVMMWSVGNETGTEDTIGIAKYVHSLDATRLTTGGTMWTGVDVAGFNGPGELPGVLERFHKQNPDQPVVLTEEPHTLQTRGFYRVRTWWRDWKHGVEFPEYGKQEIFFDGKQWYNSSYDNAVVRDNVRWNWNRTLTTPWIAGEFRWSGFDYLGEADFKGGRWPARAGNFGVIDLAMLPKDDYFLYQALWTPASKPMVHLLPDWTHPGMDGITIPVVAYSNQPEVELFLNGKSLGRYKPEGIADFLWQVPYAPGKLEAVAYDASGKQAVATSFTTAGLPETILATTDNHALKPNRIDDALVTWTVADSNGVMVPRADSRLVIRAHGPVRLLGHENGDPLDVTAHHADYRDAFYGMARSFYQATAQDGPISVTAGSILGDPHVAGLYEKHPRMVAIAVARVSLRGSAPTGAVEIHYTTDGSEPTAHSPKYAKPFGVFDNVVVKALVLLDGHEEMRLAQEFRRVETPLVSDPRWTTDSQADPSQRGDAHETQGAAKALEQMDRR